MEELFGLPSQPLEKSSGIGDGYRAWLLSLVILKHE